MGKAVLLSVALSCADQIIACPYVLQRLRLKTNNISATAKQYHSCLGLCENLFLFIRVNKLLKDLKSNDFYLSIF